MEASPCLFLGEDLALATLTSPTIADPRLGCVWLVRYPLTEHRQLALVTRTANIQAWPNPSWALYEIPDISESEGHIIRTFKPSLAHGTFRGARKTDPAGEVLFSDSSQSNLRVCCDSMGLGATMLHAVVGTRETMLGQTLAMVYHQVLVSPAKLARAASLRPQPSPCKRTDSQLACVLDPSMVSTPHTVVRDREFELRLIAKQFCLGSPRPMKKAVYTSWATGHLGPLHEHVAARASVQPRMMRTDETFCPCKRNPPKPIAYRAAIIVFARPQAAVPEGSQRAETFARIPS